MLNLTEIAVNRGGLTALTTTFICLLFLFSGMSSAQPGDAKLTLHGLTVEGNDYTDTGLIIATSGLVVGESLTGEMVQSAIRQLWELDLFSDIKIVAEKQEAGGVYLLIRVVEYPRLEFIDIGGGKKIGKDEVEEVIDLNRGQVVKPSDPVRLQRKLRALCEEKGYLLADIKVDIVDGESEGMAGLYVRVHEGRKVKVKKITFSGNEAFSDKKLRKQFNKTRQRSLWKLRWGTFHNEDYEADKELLINNYRNHGYRDAHIVSDSTWYTDDRKRMFIHIVVEEGPQLFFGKVTFTGSDLFTEDRLKRQLLFKPGDVFNQEKYDITVRERLGNLFYDRGYIYAQILPTLEPAGGDTLDVHVHIESGNRFKVHKINITGNTKTREKVIRREFVIKPGDTFDVSKLRRSVREVAILNYFADIQPDLEDVSEDEVDLWFDVEEKATDQANLSAGYSERDGMIGAIGFTAPNLFGTGQRVSFDWNFGKQYGSFSVSYTEPWFLDTETLIGGSFYHVSRRWPEGFTEKLIGGSVRLGRRFNWPDDYFRGDWIYRIERSKNVDISEFMRDHIDPFPRISSSFTQIITRDSRDFVEFPTRGSVVSLTTELAGGLLQGDDKYHKHMYSVEWYTPILPKVVLYNHFLYGFLASLTGDDRDIPHLEYLYMGGSGLSLGISLRGYDERRVGPPVVDGRLRGGKSQIKSSMELRVQMIDNPTIYGLVFAEAGNTWLNFDRTDPFDLRRSVGLGLRLYMPMIGLIGIDFGYGFDRDAYGNVPGWTPHFQFGRTF